MPSPGNRTAGSASHESKQEVHHICFEEKEICMKSCAYVVGYKVCDILPLNPFQVVR
jgi:hypothetical protein